MNSSASLPIWMAPLEPVLCVQAPAEVKTKASDGPLTIKISPDLDPSLDAAEVLLMWAPGAEAVTDAKSSL